MSETLTSLAARWRKAKLDEGIARERRLDIEEEIVALTGHKEEGSETHDAGDYKVRVTGKLTRKLSESKWAEIEPTIPEALRPVKYRLCLDTKGLRYLENNEPDVFAQIARAIETKTAKTAVTVEEK